MAEPTVPETIAARAVVHLGFGTGDAHALLLALAARVTGRDGWRLAHACGQCGSSTHGRPVLVGHPGAPHVSVARADGHALVAVCVEAPVGVDLERPGAADGLEALWELGDDADRTRAWVRTEARLKALGTGFTADREQSPATPAVQVLNLLVEDLWPHPAQLDHDSGWRIAVAAMGRHQPQLVPPHP